MERIQNPEGLFFYKANFESKDVVYASSDEEARTLLDNPRVLLVATRGTNPSVSWLVV